MVDAGSKLLKAGPAIPDQAPSMVILYASKISKLSLFIAFKIVLFSLKNEKSRRSCFEM